eukprot:scaffold408_cov71-Cylindrotheca_fusiformis.AAC.8
MSDNKRQSSSSDSGSKIPHDEPPPKRVKLNAGHNAGPITTSNDCGDKTEDQETSRPVETTSNDSETLSKVKTKSNASAATTAADKISEPGKDDVLLGRGKPFQNHPGNQRMLRIVDLHKQKYLRVKRDKKRAIVEEVLDEIQGRGARFLKRSEDGRNWDEVEPGVSFEKISHALRSKIRRPHKPKMNGSSSSSMVTTGIPNDVQLNEVLRFATMQGTRATMFPPGIFSGSLYGHDAAALGLAHRGVLPSHFYGGQNHQRHHGLVPNVVGSSLSSPANGADFDQMVRSQVVDSILRQRRQLGEALNGATGGMRLPPFM